MRKKFSWKESRPRGCKEAAQHVQRPRRKTVLHLWEELQEGKRGWSLMQREGEGGIWEAARIWAWSPSDLEKDFAHPHNSQKPPVVFKTRVTRISLHFSNPSFGSVGNAFGEFLKGAPTVWQARAHGRSEQRDKKKWSDSGNIWETDWEELGKCKKYIYIKSKEREKWQLIAKILRRQDKCVPVAFTEIGRMGGGVYFRE